MSAVPQIFPARTQLLGYRVDSLDIQDAVSRVDTFVKKGGFHHIVAINANKLWLAEQVPALRKIVRQAELVIPEYSVVWGCRALGRPLKAHVGGIMLLKALLPWLEREEVPVKRSLTRSTDRERRSCLLQWELHARNCGSKGIAIIWQYGW